MSLEEWMTKQLAAAPTVADLPPDRLAGVDFRADAAALLAAAENLAA